MSHEIPNINFDPKSVNPINDGMFNNNNNNNNRDKVNPESLRYPHCIVWTPIPLLTWLLPFIGHMGIATVSGVIRDFAGPYYVSEDNMAFGNPTRYLQLNLGNIPIVNGDKSEVWDRAVHDASEEYKKRMHNLCCDNCHSHVACALNQMRYNNSSQWNMVKLCFLVFIKGKHVSFCGFLKQWLPFLIITCIVLAIVLGTKLG